MWNLKNGREKTEFKGLTGDGTKEEAEWRDCSWVNLKLDISPVLPSPKVQTNLSHLYKWSYSHL